MTMRRRPRGRAPRGQLERRYRVGSLLIVWFRKPDRRLKSGALTGYSSRLSSAGSAPAQRERQSQKRRGRLWESTNPDLLTYPWRELSGFMGQEGMRPRERASVGDRGRSIRYAAADGWQSAI